MNMDVTLLTRLLNIIIAVLSLPPSFYLVFVLINERKLLFHKKRRINELLTTLFSLFALGAFINAILSIALIVDLDFENHIGYNTAQALFNFRNFVINVTFFIVSWGLVLIRNIRR